jgi:hypothetical protein
MNEYKPTFSREEPRREEEGSGRIACPVCGTLVDLADVAEVSRHLNGLHGAPSKSIAF